MKPLIELNHQTSYKNSMMHRDQSLSRIGINGFGRIGRMILRLALERDDFQVVGINDLSSPEQMAHLFKYDSVHGTLQKEVHLEKGQLRIGSQCIPLFSEKDPSVLPWGKHPDLIVHECTGIFTSQAKASLHLQAKAKKVIISAPSQDCDATFCMGVNESTYQPSKHHIISNASCTTNCLAPIVRVLDDTFGVVRGMLLTVHSYTNDQNILDLPHKDLRRSRAASLSQIPTTTGAAQAVGLVIPHLQGKLHGLAIRVPTPNVSLIDFTAELKNKTTRSEINEVLKKNAEGNLQGILGYCIEPLVSIDFNGSQKSATVDASLTQVIDETLIKVIAWYDNEVGFSARMLDLTRYLKDRGL